jgi:hypothetical protein
MAVRQIFALGALGCLIVAIFLHVVGLQPFAEIAADGTYLLLLVTALSWFVKTPRP